jgi:hypothetical protein
MAAANGGHAANGYALHTRRSAAAPGQNATSENIHWRHFINVTWVLRAHPGQGVRREGTSTACGPSTARKRKGAAMKLFEYQAKEAIARRRHPVPKSRLSMIRTRPARRPWSWSRLRGQGPGAHRRRGKAGAHQAGQDPGPGRGPRQETFGNAPGSSPRSGGGAVDFVSGSPVHHVDPVAGRPYHACATAAWTSSSWPHRAGEDRPGSGGPGQGLQPFQIKNAVLAWPGRGEPQGRGGVVKALYACSRKHDAELAEINPCS